MTGSKNRSVEPLSRHRISSLPSFSAARQFSVASISSDPALQTTLHGFSESALQINALWASDLEGIVSQLRNTTGVEVAIFLHELDSGEFKVSLRSNGLVDVSSVAQYFGGGGHVRAAGVTMQGSVHDVINNLLRKIAPQITEEDGEKA